MKSTSLYLDDDVHRRLQVTAKEIHRSMAQIVNEAVRDWLDTADIESIEMVSRDTFWERVDKSGECWIWQGRTDSFGYGRLRGATFDVRSSLAHRASWILSGNPDPEELCILHRCDNPPCVRPDHLFVGTRADNTADMMSKGRQVVSTDPRFFTKGTRNAQARLTNEQVVEIRKRALAGEHYTTLAKDFGISASRASGIIVGQGWRHIWPYFEERATRPKPATPLRRRGSKRE